MPAETAQEPSSSDVSHISGKRPSGPSPAVLLVALALAVRLGLMVASHGMNFGFHERYTAYFQNETTNISASIANGYGYSSPFLGVLFGDPKAGPTSWVAPIYPYFCAGIFRLFGVFSRESFFFIVLMQCIVSGLTCIPILKVGEITVGRRAGLIAAFLWAVFPWFSQWAITYIWEISLSTLLFTTLFWFALKLETSRSSRAWLGFGATWGFALLVNPSLLTLLPASLLWLGYRRRQMRLQWLKPVLIAVVTCTVVTTPWLIRNRVVFGEWAFLRPNFPFEFWMANYHGSTGRDWAGRHPTTNPEERAEYLRLGELAYVREKAALDKKFVEQYPAEFTSLTAKRFLMFWDGSTMKYHLPAAPYWLPWSFPCFSLLLLPGLVVAYLYRIRGWELFWVALLLYPIPYYLTFNQVRYRHAIEPLMLLLISFAVVAMADWFRGSIRHDGDVSLSTPRKPPSLATGSAAVSPNPMRMR